MNYKQKTSKTLRYACLIAVIVLGLATIIGTGGSSDNGNGIGNGTENGTTNGSDNGADNGNGASNKIIVGKWILPSADRTTFLEQGWMYDFDENGLGYARMVAFQHFGQMWTTLDYSLRIIEWEYAGGLLTVGGLTTPQRTYKIDAVTKRDERIFINTTDPVFGGATFFIQCLDILCRDVPGPHTF